MAQDAFAEGTVDRVIDGDTFSLAGTKTNVRLQGVSAPELGDETGAGQKAKAGLAKLLPVGSKVRLKNRETQPASGNFPERHIAIVEKTDQTNINAEIIRAGWAIPARQFLNQMPYAQQQVLRNALIEARNKKVGLWGASQANRHSLLGTINDDFPGNIEEIEELEGLDRIPGATKIGTIWLYVPPAQITVTERNSNIDFPTVRTPGTPKIKSTQQEQRIEMSVIFPNLWSINYQFRAILAQFIRSPFLPLENEHIQDLLLPSYIIPRDDVDEQLGIKAEEQARVAKLAAEKAAQEGRRIGQDPLSNRDIPPVVTSQNRPAPRSQRVDSLKLYIALRNMVVTTIPSIPQAIQVTFVMSVFNYLPHTSDIQYLRKMPDIEKQIDYLKEVTKLRFPDTPDPDVTLQNSAGTTKDISMSDPFKRYYKTLLSESVINIEDGGLTWGKGVTPRLFPIDERNMNGISMELETNKITNEEIGRNRDEIRALEASIIRRLRSILGAATRRGGASQIVDDTASRLFASLQGIVSLISEKIFDRLPNAITNMETALSTNDILIIRKTIDGDPRYQNILTSIQNTVLDRNKATAKDILDAAINGVLGTGDANSLDPSISQSISRIFRLEHKNRYGTEEIFNVPIRNGPNTVISGFSASFSPQMVAIPIIEHLNPSMQYMGKSDWVVSLNMQTADQDLMRRLTHMSQLARVTRLVRESAGSRWFSLKLNSIKVQGDGRNNGMFNLLGIGHVLVEDFVYESIKDKPGWFNLSIRMVQADLDIGEYERLIPSNVLGDGIIDQILKNITTGNFQDKNKTVRSILNTIRQASRQMPFLIGRSISEDTLDANLSTGSVQKALIAAAPSLDRWKETIKEQFGPGPEEGLIGAVARGTNTKIATGVSFASFATGVGAFVSKVSGFTSVGIAVVGSAPLAAKTVIFQDELRIKLARQVFRQAVGAAIREGIAKQPSEMLALYDPVLAASTKKDDRGAALRRLAFSNDKNTTNFLHGCYPDLELPLFADSPLLTSPDFFYKKEDRLPENSVQSVRDRLDSIFDVIQENFSTGEVLPGDMMEDLRLLKMRRELRSGKLVGLLDEQVSIDLAKVNAAVAEEVSLSAQAAIEASNRNVNSLTNSEKEQELVFAKGRVFNAGTEAEIRDFIKNLEVNEFANISRTERIAVHKLYLIMKIAEAQDKISRGERIDGSIRGKKLRDTPHNKLKSIQNDALRELEAISLYGGVNDGSLLDGSWGAVSPSSLRLNRFILDKTMISQINRARGEGASGSLARSYPTAKIYFIEEDSKEWEMFDDYYAYSAIRSIQVVSSKTSASKVATIQLSNITQRLTDSRPQGGENVFKDQSSEEQNINSLFLREGMTIMVRMGYSNDPNLLERTFMGKIVSVTAGDVIQIIAQSFGAELTAPVFGGQQGKHGFWGSARSHGDVAAIAMGSVDGLDHFGNRSWLERLNVKDSPFSEPEFEGLAYSAPKYRKWDYWVSLINPIGEVLKFGVHDPRLENVYLPFTGIVFSPQDVILNFTAAHFIGAGKASYEFVKAPVDAISNIASGKAVDQTSIDGLTNSVFSVFRGLPTAFLKPLGRVVDEYQRAGSTMDSITTNPGFDWFYNSQNLWNLLNEMALYHNDYIVTTLPYNDDIWGWQRETLYVGPRTGFYKYTERFDDADVAKKIFEKNKRSDGLPIDFVKKGVIAQDRITRQKFARDRGFDKARSGTDPRAIIGGQNLITLSLGGAPNTLYIANNEETGNVVSSSYITRIPHRKFGHYVLLRTPQNDTKAASVALQPRRNVSTTQPFTESGFGVTVPSVDLNAIPTGPELLQTKRELKSYVLIYGFRDPNEITDPDLKFDAQDAIDNIREKRQISLGDIVGIHRSGASTKQIFFTVGVNEALRGSLDGDNWKLFDMIEIIRRQNFEDAGGIEKRILPLDPVEKDASRFLININNPAHLLDEQKNIITGYAPVQQYHWIDSRHDIIENMITASAEEIHNKVTIRFPDEPGNPADNELTVVADDNIRAGHIRHLISEQQNVDPGTFDNIIGLMRQRTLSSLAGRLASATLLPTKYTVASNVLAREMRPMYRGSIKIWGRPSIRPHDVVYMNDQVNQMFGPFEVAEVIHDYSSENGFVTTIIPSAIVTVRDQSRVYQQIAMGGLIIPYFDRSMSDMIGGALKEINESVKKVTNDEVTTEDLETIVPVAAGAAVGSQILPSGRRLARLLVKRFLLGEVTDKLLQSAKDVGSTALGKATQATKTGLKGKKKLSRPFGRIFGRLLALKNAARGSKVLGATQTLIGGGSRIAVGGGAVGITAILGLMAVNSVWKKGVAKVMGRDIITVTGLFYNGQPFLAGLEGAYKDSYTVHFMDWVTNMFTFSGQQEDWSHGTDFKQ